MQSHARWGSRGNNFERTLRGQDLEAVNSHGVIFGV